METSQKIWHTNKTVVLGIDDTWRLHLLDLNEVGQESKRGYIYSLVKVASFSKFGWTILMKNESFNLTTKAFTQCIGIGGQSKFKQIWEGNRTQNLC